MRKIRDQFLEVMVEGHLNSESLSSIMDRDPARKSIRYGVVVL